jgi:hypothetical protein
VPGDQDPETEFAQDTSKEMFHSFFVALSSFLLHTIRTDGIKATGLSGHFDPFSS